MIHYTTLHRRAVFAYILNLSSPPTQNTHPPLQTVNFGKTRISIVKPARKLESSPVLATHAQFLSRQRSQSEGSEGEPSTPPPSVWKVPEYFEPKWNPGKPESKTDVVNGL